MSDKANNFQQELKELEEIVEWFESSEADLDEALVKFDRGMQLAEELKDRLDTMENKVKEIKQKFSQEAPEDTLEEEDDTGA